LLFAVVHTGVGMDGRIAQVVHPAGRGTRLIPPENAAVSLQGLAQAAGPGLQIAGSLARALGAQTLANLLQAVLPPCKIVTGAVDVDDPLAGRAHPVQYRHCSGERTYMVLVTAKRLFGGDGTVASVARQDFLASVQDQGRHFLGAWIAAGGALRPT